MLNSIITINEHIQSGVPVFKGTRVPVKTFFDYISTGETIETYLEDYPYINESQLYALISYLGSTFFDKINASNYEDIN